MKEPAPPVEQIVPKSKRGAIAVLVAIVVAVCLLMFLLVPREPSYQGKSLSTWLNCLNDDQNKEHLEKVQEAITAMGTNALPHLYKYATHQRGSSKEMFLKLLYRTVPRNWASRRLSGREILIHPSWFALQTLGTNALPIVPALVDSLSNNFQSFYALYAIGSGAEPALEELCGHSDPSIRRGAAIYFAQIVNEKPLFSLLPPNRWVSGETEFGLFPVQSDGTNLVANLKHSNPAIKAATIEALKHSYYRSTMPRDALEKMMTDKDAEISKAAREIFAFHYTEAAGKAGIK